MIRLRRQGQREAKRQWRQVKANDLDGTFPVMQLELTVSTLQREAARLSSAYLSAFISSELGEPERPPALTVWDKTFGGNPLREGLRSAVIKAKQRIDDGMDPTEATKASGPTLIADVGLFIDTAARETLRQGMEDDERIVGYQRAVKGTCGACSGDTQYEAFSPNAPVASLNIHPGCLCVAEPVLSGVPNRFPRPTGPEIFDSLSPEKQDEVLGPEAAAMVRNGDAVLADFVHVDGGFIRQKPVEMVHEAKAFTESEHPRAPSGRFQDKPGSDKPKVPQWKRNQKYNGWVRSLSPAEQEALARQFYGKLWAQLQAYFGDIGQPPPNLIFNETNIPAGMEAVAFRDEKGIRQIQMRPSAILKLALRGGTQQSETLTITHEWRHIFQNASLAWIGRDLPHDDQPAEQDAIAFSAEVSRIMAANRRRKRRRRPLIKPYVYNPQNISENIGKDPTTIPY